MGMFVAYMSAASLYKAEETEDKTDGEMSSMLYAPCVQNTGSTMYPNYTPDACNPCGQYPSNPCGQCRPNPCGPCPPNPCGPCPPNPCGPCLPNPCRPCPPNPCGPCGPDNSWVDQRLARFLGLLRERIRRANTPELRRALALELDYLIALTFRIVQQECRPCGPGFPVFPPEIGGGAGFGLLGRYRLLVSILYRMDARGKECFLQQARVGEFGL